MRHARPLTFLGLLALLLCSAPLSAAVGLVTVPMRDTVRMTIYNAVDLTLIQEARTLILKKGLNRIQYQWAGTLIDSTSLELRPLEKAADVELLNLIYPPNAPATLVWEVDSKVEGPVRFEISYFTSGLGWQADYVLRASGNESVADVEGWVAVGNGSGEDYPRAEVRLVVGTINLVERIRDLATGQLRDRERRVEKDEMRKAGRALMARPAAAPMAAADAAMLGENMKRAEVVSARIADYHIFTVSGVQAVMNGATTRFLAITNKEPLAIEVLYRIASDALEAQKLYRFINDKEHQLPDGPLPEGTWNVFRVTDAKERTLSYSGAAGHAYVPPGQKVELNLGADPGIAVKQVDEGMTQSDFHYNNNGNVDGWVEHRRLRFKLVNTKPIPVSLEYLVVANGDWTVTGLVGEKRDLQRFRHQDRVDAGKVLELGPFTVSTRQGVLSTAAGGIGIPIKPVAPAALPAVEVSPK
jgi:hypothetical protein